MREVILTALLALSGIVMSPIAVSPTARPARAGETISLPEHLATGDLARLLLDRSKSCELVDVRPAWQHAEFAIPGSKTVAPQALVAHVRSLPRDTFLVLVDRDGTDSFAFAGALLARGDAVRVGALVGGVVGWYRDVELERVGTTTRDPSMGKPPGAAPRPDSVPEAGKKKRNAGC